MSYSAPPAFAHGDYPTAANLTKLSDGLSFIYASLNSGKSVTFLVKSKDTTLSYFSDSSPFNVCVHIHRWLFYTGEGTMKNIAQTQTTSLPDAGGTNIFDLDSVEWLTYGMPYMITGVDFALEDWEP
jgi:hypothetical protein